jgi:hypothetical protein
LNKKQSKALEDNTQDLRVCLCVTEHTPYRAHENRAHGIQRTGTAFFGASPTLLSVGRSLVSAIFSLVKGK